MNRIRELREDRDLRQSDVAAATGIDQRTLSNYETGKTSADSEAIIKLAAFFGVSCDYLLGVSDYNVTGVESVYEELEEMKRRLTYLQNIIGGSQAFLRFNKQEHRDEK